MSETMIERVARAISISLEENPDAIDTPYEIRGWRLHRSTARAAIEAMRTPTEAMVNEGAEAVPSYEQSIGMFGAEACWNLMLDAALTEDAPS